MRISYCNPSLCTKNIRELKNSLALPIHKRQATILGTEKYIQNHSYVW